MFCAEAESGLAALGCEQVRTSAGSHDFRLSKSAVDEQLAEFLLRSLAPARTHHHLDVDELRLARLIRGTNDMLDDHQRCTLMHRAPASGQYSCLERRLSRWKSARTRDASEGVCVVKVVPTEHLRALRHKCRPPAASCLRARVPGQGRRGDNASASMHRPAMLLHVPTSQRPHRV